MSLGLLTQIAIGSSNVTLPKCGISDSLSQLGQLLSEHHMCQVVPLLA